MIGQIVKVVYLPNRQPPMRPDMVLVKVPQYLGPSCLENEKNVVTIVERTSDLLMLLLSTKSGIIGLSCIQKVFYNSVSYK